jgi:hypothetical protein
MFGSKVAWTERAATSIEVGLPPTPQTTGPRLTKSASRHRSRSARRRHDGVRRATPKPARLGAALQALGPSRATGPLYPQVHGQGQLGEPGCDPELVARSSAASPRHIPRGARAVANLGTRGGGERGTGPYPHALRRSKPDRNLARDPPVTLLQVCSRTPPTPARQPVPPRLSLLASTRGCAQQTTPSARGG